MEYFSCIISAWVTFCCSVVLVLKMILFKVLFLNSNFGLPVHTEKWSSGYGKVNFPPIYSFGKLNWTLRISTILDFKKNKKNFSEYVKSPNTFVNSNLCLINFSKSKFLFYYIKWNLLCSVHSIISSCHLQKLLWPFFIRLWVNACVNLDFLYIVKHYIVEVF